MGRFGRVLVTGGAGFVGSHVCEALLERGSTVVCVDNIVTGSRRNIAILEGHPEFTFIQADITEAIDIDGPLDLILHLASPASPYDYLRLPIETMTVGSVGTMHALELAEAKGARFLLTSTSEVYGDPEIHPQPETYWGNVNPVGPRAVYDESKRFAEALTTAFRTARGVNTVIVRLFNSYGPRMRGRDGRAIPTFIRQALAGEPLTVAGHGSQTRSVTYVSDTVRGILAVAETDISGPVNIGSTNEMTVLQLRHRGGSSHRIAVPHRVRPAPGRRPQGPLPRHPTHRADRGVAARVSWPDGLAATIAYFRDTPDEWSESASVSAAVAAEQRS